MPEAAAAEARTPGAKRAGPGEYYFDMAKLNHIMGGPEYSSANGTCVEGDRMMVALMRKPAGTGAEPHSHPNEQWIFVIEGTLDADVGGKKERVEAGSVIYVPSNVVHSTKVVGDRDVVFFTCKDTSHGLHGIKQS
jgi:quercetin dioxygenase-like cupin family protein